MLKKEIQFPIANIILLNTERKLLWFVRENVKDVFFYFARETLDKKSSAALH